MLPSIAHEAHVLGELHKEGWKGDAETLRELAQHGAILRTRYENSCSYPWATTSTYSARTKEIENRCVAYALANELNIYLQTDPRGATIYVREYHHPISDSDYSSVAQCIYFERG